MESDAKLVFVYRTDATPMSLMAEFVREIRPGEEHECTLCHLTYNKVRKNPEWTRYIKGLSLNSRFVLRDRFLRKHPEFSDREFPAVFVGSDKGALEEFLTAAEINTCEDIGELIRLVDQRLVQFDLAADPTAS